MSEPTSRYGVLVAVDGSPESDVAAGWAAREAAARHTRLTLMNVNPPMIGGWSIGSLEAGLSEWQDSNSQRVIEQARKVVQSAAGEGAEPEVHTEVTYSPVVPALAAASKNAEMIVVGSRGMGAFGRAVLGSISSGMVHHAHCPVAVIRQEGAEARDTLPVVVGVDGSPASEAATAWAFDEASRRGVDLVALHAWSDLGATPTIGMDWEQFEEDGKEVLAERLAGWREKYPDVSVQRRIVYNRPVHWLVEESEKAQLVVVGSHGRGGFTGMLLGSVSAAVVQEAKSPVVVVRPR